MIICLRIQDILEKKARYWDEIKWKKEIDCGTYPKVGTAENKDKIVFKTNFKSNYFAEPTLKQQNEPVKWIIICLRIEDI